MSVVDRVKNILLTPKTEWPVIAVEPASVSSIYTGYAIPVALLPLIGSLLGSVLFAHMIGFSFALVAAVIAYVVGLALLYVMALIADALAPGFDGRKSQIQAFKLVTYSATPQWVAGFFSFIPGLNLILALAGFAYGAYLLYLGSQAVMGVPEAKAAGYTAVTIIIWIVLGIFVMSAIVGAVVAAMLGGMALSGPYAV